MKKIDLITEEEILSSLTKDEDRILMNNLKKLKAIEDIENVLSKIPFLKKLVSNNGEKKQLTKELLNRVNYIRKAEDFKYGITEKDVKKPFKKITEVSKNKIEDVENNHCDFFDIFYERELLRRIVYRDHDTERVVRDIFNSL